MKKTQCCRCQEDIQTTLKDAGFDEATSACFLAKKEQGRYQEGLCILSKQRAKLLDELHHTQKQLDCLDFLIYQLRKEQGK